MKVVLWAVIAAAIVLWVMRTRRLTDDVPSSPGRHADSETTEKIEQCVHCGVYLPSSECVTDTNGRFYCSDAHRRAADA